MKSAFIRARVEPSLKKSAELVLKQLGVSPSEAVNLFYRQIVLTRGLPLEIKLPNEETLKTFALTDKGEDLIVCKDAEDMFSRLEI